MIVLRVCEIESVSYRLKFALRNSFKHSQHSFFAPSPFLSLLFLLLFPSSPLLFHFLPFFYPPLPFFPHPSSLSSLPFLFPFSGGPPFPKTARRSGSAVSSPVEKGFGEYLSQKEQLWWQQFCGFCKNKMG